jgi:thiosulfate/3-mercaptopyruvate sulfurtransferase
MHATRFARRLAWAVGIVSLCLAAGVLRADDPVRTRAATMLIEPEQLQKALDQPRLRLLDTRPRADYDQGHIPGAVPVEVKRWQQLGQREGGLHDAAAWAKEVGRLGIGRATHVVVYGASLPDSGRVWWTLTYLGCANVSLLDGGWNVWVKEKRPTETTATAVQATHFEPRFQADRLEEIGPLKKALHAGAVTVVDTRSQAEYTGQEMRGKRGGHIQGARHLEWKELLRPDGRFKSPEELRALFRERGIEPEQTAVTC